MLRLIAGLAFAALALTACHPAGNNLVPAGNASAAPSRSVMDGSGGPPQTGGAVVASPTPAPTLAPMDGSGGPPQI